jgi:hypothetical protein
LDIDAGLTKPAALPVNLISFNGALNGSIAKLNWVVSNEVNLSHYELERSSNGTSYAAIANVTARGNTSGLEDYIYQDNIAGLGVNKIYYRLKIVDKNGVVKYSNIVIVRLNGIKISTIYPNPIADFVRVELEAKVKENAQIRIMDMSGKVVLTQLEPVQIGGNQITINGLGKLSRGTYIIEITTGTEKLREKLTKQ